MSGNYYYLRTNSRRGKIAISHKAFEDIATNAAKSLEGVEVEGGAISLLSPAKASFRKDGRVEISLSVTLPKGSDAHAKCLAIQKAVADDLLSMTDVIPLSVAVKVARFR